MSFFVRYTCINEHKEQRQLNCKKEEVYETDYFSRGNENFPFIQ